MTRLYYAIPTSSRAEEVYFAVRAGYEIILLIISSFKFRKHALGAKRLTDIVMFHIAHMTFCVLAAAKESWTVYILFEYAHEGALDCYYEGISSITAAPQHVALAVSLALFFNHWERAYASAAVHRRNSRWRNFGYTVAALSTIAFLSTTLIVFGASHQGEGDRRRCLRDSTVWVSWSVFLLGIMLFIDSSWLAWLSLQKKRQTQSVDSIRNSLTPKMFRLRERKNRLGDAGNTSEFPSDMEASVQRREQSSISLGSSPQIQENISTRWCLSRDEWSSLSFEYQPHVFAFSSIFTFIGLMYLVDRLFFVYEGAQPGLGQYVMFKALSFMPFSFLMLAYMWQPRHLKLNRDVIDSWRDSGAKAGVGTLSTVSSHRKSDPPITRTETFHEDSPIEVQTNPFESVPHTASSDSTSDPGLLTMTRNKMNGKHGDFFKGEPDDTDDEDRDGGEDAAAEHAGGGTVQERLTKGAPLTSSLTIVLEDPDDELESASSSQLDDALARRIETSFHGPVEGSPAELLMVEEDCRPFVDTLLLARLYSRFVALPIFLEEQLNARADIAKLLELSKPKRRSKKLGAITTEVWRKYEELGDMGKLLMKKYSNFERILSDLAETSAAAAALPTESSEFKRSKDKKVDVLSMIPTNLYIHQSILEASLSIDNSSSVPAEEPLEAIDVTSITFGAPAAHLLGFKKGGLKALRAKVQADSSKLTTPDAIFDHLKAKCALAIREKVVFSQALGAIVAAATSAIVNCISSRRAPVLRRWGIDRAGLLVQSVSLLSTIGSEEGMIDDFAAAYENLSVVLRIDKSESVTGDRNASNELIQHVDEDPPSAVWTEPVAVRVVGVAGTVKNAGKVTVTLRVTPPEASAWALNVLEKSFRAQALDMPLVEAGDLKLVPVLFNLGVNENQTVANAKRKTAIQTAINRRGVKSLTAYHKDCTLFQDEEPILSPEIPSLLAQLHDLVELEIKERGKHVDLPLVACYVTRLLNGARTTSCKSAKDRTSVFHTLEVAKMAARNGLLGRRANKYTVEYRTRQVADILRGIDCVRLRNAELNTGVPKYAFNLLQLQALPPELRPPTETAKGGQS